MHCEECDKNFYWNETHCEPCNCNPFGTLAGTDCLNGICQCQHGFKGQKCDRCINEREFIQNGICTGMFFIVYLKVIKRDFSMLLFYSNIVLILKKNQNIKIKISNKLITF